MGDNFTSMDRMANSTGFNSTGYGFKYLVDFPNQNITDTSESAIDNLFIIFKIKVKVNGLNTQLSDHNSQLLEICIKNNSKAGY